MIDTHAHLYFASYDSDREDVFKKCRRKLSRLVNVGIDLSTSRECVRYANENQMCYAVIGFHPEEATSYEISGGKIHDAMNALEELIVGSEKVVAIGEIGIDYHTNDVKIDHELQARWFRAQIEMAMNHDLSVVIHSRDAFEDTLKILREYTNVGQLQGVWHSFTEDHLRIKQVLELGLFIGVNGIITFPSAKMLCDAIANMPKNRLVLETDSPFLAPQVQRGKRNDPTMVEYVAQMVGKLWEMPFKEVVSITDENAYNLFSRMR